MIEKVEGIVIKEMNYGDTSKILTLLTKEYGIIGVISKGCRNIKSPLFSLSNKLTHGFFHIYYKKDKLSILKTIDNLNYFKEIRKDIMKIGYANYILELTEQVFKQNSNNDIIDLLLASLIKIDEDFEPDVITSILELKYLDYLGVMPVLDSCAICGSSANIKTLSFLKGGYICATCYQNDFVVSQKTIKMIRMFYYVEISKIDKINISTVVKQEIRNFLEKYYDEYTGLYLNSRKFLKELLKIG